MIRVLLLEDTPAVRNELHALLIRQEGIMLVGEAYNVESVLQLSASQPVDVVVMDIRMPHICGMSTVRRILEDYPHAKIVLVSMQSDIRYVQENIRAGVSGYVLKDCVYEELVEAVHIASAGGQFISPEIENDIP